ncbi:MAG: PH domain-containing protein [Clostridia bacterium]|nr:PH domain-containing protein [Clostridia bacterium]
MFDFQNPEYIKLKSTKDRFEKELDPILIHGEEVIDCYKSVRDGVIFTNKRIIVISVEGVTGKKKDITSFPYSKIQSFSVETSGVFDIDSELELWLSGMGKARFEFTGGTNVYDVCRLISNFVL